MKVYIKSYEAVSVAGYGIDEIFKNILNKKCLLSQDSKFQIFEDKALLTGRIADFDKAIEFCGAIAHEGVVVFESESSMSALCAAYEEIKSGKSKEALVLDSYKLDDNKISNLYEDGKYSDAVAKPFDIECDGINAGEAVVSALLSSESGEAELLGLGNGPDMKTALIAALANSKITADEVEYIEACARGIKSEDIAETAELTALFGDKPLTGSSKGLTGHAFGSSTLLSLCISLKIMKEEIVPASSFLEHAFSDELNLSYANKSKKINVILINSNEDESEYAAVIVKRVW